MTSAELVRSLGGGRFMNWVANDSEGASKWILIFCDSQIIQLLDKEEDQFSLSCRFQQVDDKLIWRSCEATRRKDLWLELGAIRRL